MRGVGGGGGGGGGVGVLGIEAREVVTGLSSHRPRGFADRGHQRLRIVDFLLFFFFFSFLFLSG